MTVPVIKPTAAELLDLLVSKAKSLRDAGVLHVELDGCSFVLAPSDGPVERRVPAEEVPIVDDGDPFADPATYGGSVPGFKRRGRDDGDGN